MSTETKEEVVEKKSISKKGKIILGAVGLLGAVLLGIYFYNVDYYKNHFLPHTYVNGIDCSNCTVEEVAGKVAETERQSYILSVKDGEEVLFTVNPEDAGMSFEATDEMKEVLKKQNPYSWLSPVFLGAKAEITVKPAMTYNAENLSEYLSTLDILKYTDDKKAKDAYIGEYDPQTKQFTIIPEQVGFYILEDDVRNAVIKALNSQEAELSVSEKIARKSPKITADDKELNKKVKGLNALAGANITYDWNGTKVVVDSDVIREWIVEADGEYVLDEAKVAEFVAENAEKYDTYGKDREFTTISGETLTLPSGAYGWKTDQEAETQALIENIKASEVIEKEPVYSKKGYVKGSNDIGTSYVEIDLTNQHLYLIMEGEVVLESDFVSGDISKKRRTPPGVFGITYKTKNAVLRGADYETPVSYWMPFNRNIGMHDATWRRSFGGEIYKTNGSHGCVNLPKKNAAAIYDYMENNFPVVCYYY